MTKILKSFYLGRKLPAISWGIFTVNGPELCNILLAHQEVNSDREEKQVYVW